MKNVTDLNDFKKMKEEKAAQESADEMFQLISPEMLNNYKPLTKNEAIELMNVDKYVYPGSDPQT